MNIAVDGSATIRNESLEGYHINRRRTRRSVDIIAQRTIDHGVNQSLLITGVIRELGISRRGAGESYYIRLIFLSCSSERIDGA
jgi:hypothetical protein